MNKCATRLQCADKTERKKENTHKHRKNAWIVDRTHIEECEHEQGNNEEIEFFLVWILGLFIISLVCNID